MKLRCLWLARTLPFPLTAGDRIYSAKLAGALAISGASVTFVGIGDADGATNIPGLRWKAIPGAARSHGRSVFSAMPLVAARHATSAYQAAIREMAAQGPWDAIILDQYGMGWVLDHLNTFRPSPLLVFVAHDHETSVTRLQFQDRANALVTRAYLLQNHLKTRRFERRVVAAADLITAITAEDRDLFLRDRPGARVLVLPPGYDGRRVAAHPISRQTPRHIVLLGSYRWSAKQASLKAFLDAADAAMRAASIETDIVGDIPDEFARLLVRRYRAVHVVGAVSDTAPYLDARLAVLAESIGGGFKLKLLDYVFHRVPVAALCACTAGVPTTLRDAMLLASDLGALVKTIIAEIDNTDRLDQLQQAAFSAADGAFNWADRGQILFDALARLRHPSELPRGRLAEDRTAKADAILLSKRGPVRPQMGALVT